MEKQAQAMTANTMRDANRFRKAANVYTRKATQSKETARETLVRLGISTQKGNLTKNYK